MPNAFTITQETRIDGRYQVRERLGRGGAGEVYLVEDVTDGSQRALKILRDAAQRGRFQEEVHFLSELYHKNVVEYAGSGRLRGGPYFLVTEYMPGGALDRALAEARLKPDAPWLLRSGLPRRIALELARQCADGLAYVHRQGIAHRDLKPANLLLVDRLDPARPEAVRLKLADFGIASKDQGNDPQHTAQGSFVGTMLYASPEHLEQVVSHRRDGSKGKTKRSVDEEKRGDLFALGLILYELWAGTTFVTDNDRQDAARRHLGGTEEIGLEALKLAMDRFRLQVSLMPAAEPEFELMASLLQADPTRRPSAEQVLKQIQRLSGPHADLDARDTFVDTLAGSVPAPHAPPRRSSRLLTHALTLLAGAALGIGLTQRLAGPQTSAPALRPPHTASADTSAPQAPKPSTQAPEIATALVQGAAAQIGDTPQVGDAPQGDSAPKTADAPPDAPAPPQPAQPQAAVASAPEGQSSADAPAGAPAAREAASDNPANSLPIYGAALTIAIDDAPIEAHDDAPVGPPRSAPDTRVALAPSARLSCEEAPRQDPAVLALLSAGDTPSDPTRGKGLSRRCLRSEAEPDLVYLDVDIQAGSFIYAPTSGELRLYKSSRPDGQRSYCAVISHPLGVQSKVCGLQKGKLQVTGGEVSSGQWLGKVDGTAKLTWSLYEMPEAGGDRVATDVRQLLKPTR